jgi:hypothetical protein
MYSEVVKEAEKQVKWLKKSRWKFMERKKEN